MFAFQDGVYKMSLSPSGTVLAVVHHSGMFSLWDIPSLRTRKLWKQQDQPGFDEINPSGGSRIFQMGGRCFVANGGAHILFSGKKCMKLKEIGLKWGGARLLAPCYSKITIFL